MSSTPATYVLGDVHGCFVTLDALLAELPIDWRHDRLWVVGDLVNRGPASLEVLRWARRTSLELGDRFVCVLGNHDLHLLARAAGLADSKRLDTLEEVLAAHDRRDLLEWLRVRPVLHRDRIASSNEPVVVVHAGLLPAWSLEQAEEKADAIQHELERHGVLLHRQPTPNEPPRLQAMREDLAIFTRLRVCDVAGNPVRFAAAPEQAPSGVVPWFSHPGRSALHDRGVVLFGHWAAMGLHLGQHEIGLDSGCAWGGPLTAIRLEDRQVFQVPRRDPEPVGRGHDDDA